MDDRIITSKKLKEDSFETSIRPKTIDEYNNMTVSSPNASSPIINK